MYHTVYKISKPVIIYVDKKDGEWEAKNDQLKLKLYSKDLDTLYELYIPNKLRKMLRKNQKDIEGFLQRSGINYETEKNYIAYKESFEVILNWSVIIHKNNDINTINFATVLGETGGDRRSGSPSHSDDITGSAKVFERSAEDIWQNHRQVRDKFRELRGDRPGHSDLWDGFEEFRRFYEATKRFREISDVSGLEFEWDSGVRPVTDEMEKVIRRIDSLNRLHIAEKMRMFNNDPELKLRLPDVWDKFKKDYAEFHRRTCKDHSKVVEKGGDCCKLKGKSSGFDWIRRIIDKIR